jgi:choline-glycine betaine transporter
MTHTNRIGPWALAAAAFAVVLVALGLPAATLLPVAILIACPLMMIVMMGGMAGSASGEEDHRGHGCEHDATRRTDPPAPLP